WNKWNDTSREVHEMFKTTAIDTLKQDKKCQACWYIILSTMSGSTTSNPLVELLVLLLWRAVSMLCYLIL
ncbi:MAG TPA: hypothetical protein VEL11_04010, partial [Candidatus Bathyarchaeia archaeon]|nr:hypothetical protein [Candidatus Bathyarchaeia archaeon]